MLRKVAGDVAEATFWVLSSQEELKCGSQKKEISKDLWSKIEIDLQKAVQQDLNNWSKDCGSWFFK